MNYLEEKLTALLQGEQNRPVGLIEKKYSRWQLISGLKLGPADKIGRILSLYRMGYEAEMKSHVEKADFFFHKALTFLKKVFKENESWESVIKKYELNENVDTFRRKLIFEVLMGIHLVFFKNFCNKGREKDQSERQTKHLKYLRFLSINCLTENDLEKEFIIDDIEELLVQTYEKRNEWNRAVKICIDLIKTSHRPQFFKRKLADLYFNTATKEKHIFDSIADLSTHIQKLENLCIEFPYDIDIYNLIGVLYFQLALNNSNSDNHAKALLDISKAAAFNPLIPDLNETKMQLRNLMEGVRNSAKRIFLKNQSIPGTKLTVKDKKIMKESKRGFTLMDDYLESDKYKKVVANRRKAYLRDIWSKVFSLQPDQDQNWEKQAEELDLALQKILLLKKFSDETILSEWLKMVEDFPKLKNIQEKTIVNFVKDFDLTDDNTTPKQKMYQLKSKLFIDSPTNAIQPITHGNGKKESIPIDFWLFSKRDIFFKAMGTVAILLLLVMTHLSITEPMKAHSRNLAYERIVAAVNNNRNDDFVSLTKNVESFLNNLPKLKNDSRERYVREIYESEFYRWFIDQKNNDQEELTQQAHKYKKIMGR